MYLLYQTIFVIVFISVYRFSIVS